MKILILMLLITSCKSLPSYVSDRGSDLADIAEVSMGFGGAMSILPGFSTNIFGLPFGMGLADGPQIGLRGGELGAHNDTNFVIGLGSQAHATISSNKDTVQRILFRRKHYCTQYGPHSYCIGTSPNSKSIYTHFSLDIHAFLFVAHVGFNPGEVIDFFGGIFGLDLYDDDYYKNYEGSVLK